MLKFEGIIGFGIMLTWGLALTSLAEYTTSHVFLVKTVAMLLFLFVSASMAGILFVNAELHEEIKKHKKQIELLENELEIQRANSRL